MRTKKYIKIFSLFLACLIFITCLTSCALDTELREVGKVGEYDVLYEELYFLANSYKANLEDKYGEYSTLDAEKKAEFDGKLEELVYTNIITNYAVLDLCKDAGLTIKDAGVEDRVDEYIKFVIESNFDGSKSDYKESMEAYCLTDHYVRFTSAVDLIYSDLLANELEKSEAELSEEALMEIVKTEFARTWHIMIFNDEGESREANRVKAEEALSKLRDGSMTMYKLIGSSYNEDLSLTTLDGIYFAKGTRDKAYETAAFSLEPGGVSDVIELSYVNPQGVSTNAFCILQRLEIEDVYVNQNFASLREEYVKSKISIMLDDIKADLSFEPNEYGASLELSDLEDAGAISTAFVILVLVSLVLVTAAVVVIVIVVKKKKSPNGKTIKK